MIENIEVDQGELISFFIDYLQNHTYFQTRSLSNSFIQEVIGIKANRININDLKSKYSHRFGAIVRKVKRHNLIEEYGSKSYKVNKNKDIKKKLVEILEAA